MNWESFRRARSRAGRWLIPVAAAMALVLPSATMAQQDQGVLPVVTDDVVAVVDGSDVAAVAPDQGWIDPAAAPTEGWVVDPNAAPVDPAADPNAIPVEAAPADAADAIPVEPAVPVDQLPAINPSLAPPPSTGNLTPGANWNPPA
ncbi:MAG: hypothetical protein IT337_01485, partial [Thermomicrobiales bacterium]|nr:hypothetical protein [Thermomicrobiales bacterium]